MKQIHGKEVEHEHEDGTVHSHEDGHLPHEHEDVVEDVVEEEVVEDVVEEVVEEVVEDVVDNSGKAMPEEGVVRWHKHGQEYFHDGFWYTGSDHQISPDQSWEW